MKKLILLLRAINLGKVNKVLMSELKLHLTEMGYINVKTLLQSGNVSIETEHFNHAECVAKLSVKFGFDIPVIITTHETLLSLCQHDLFKENSMVIFTNQKIDNDMIELFSRELTDEHVVLDQCILINYSTSYHKTKFNNNWFERKLKYKTTIRNRNTVLKMIESFR